MLTTAGPYPCAPSQPAAASIRETETSAPTAKVLFPRLILIAIGFFALAGIAFALWLRRVPAGNADPRLAFNVFYYLFARNEPAGLGVVALFSFVSAILLFRRARFTSLPVTEALLKWFLPAAAGFVFVVALLGTDLVSHNYALTADENMADFQARIFMRGQAQAEVSKSWLDAVRVIKPIYAEYFPGTHSWNATYYPVYAAMRAVFQLLHLEALLNPVLAAITVLAIYGAARNIWPTSRTNALLSVALLASSSQFLVMSMTSYSMPAHLALNAIWLWLYSRPDRPAFYLAPFVGVLAIGLHQPIVHALFVLPFLVRLVWQCRWRAVIAYGLVYLAGCAIWFSWHSRFQTQNAAGAASVFKFANPRMPIIQSMDLCLIISWSCLATPLLALLGCARFRKLPPIVQDATLSCLLTFGFYFFFYLDQAHGWGYRYFYGALGCFIIVAVAGFDRLCTLVGSRTASAFVLSGIVVSILVQLPLRCRQAEQFVRPYARAASVLHAMPYAVVALDARDAWYSADLIRNDPFLEQRPIIVSIFGLTPSAITALEKKGTVRFITHDDLTKLGLFTGRPDPHVYAHDPFELGRGK